MTTFPKYPTEFLEVPPDAADQVQRLLEGTLDPEKYPSVTTYLRQCYHRPSAVSLVLLAVNEVLEGHGVEALYSHDHWDAYHGNVEASFVNMGESSLPTVIRDHRWDDWLVSSLEDFVEQHEGRFE